MLLHFVNIAVMLTAAWVYLHPFDAARPSMNWVYVAHGIGFVPVVIVLAQAFLFQGKRTGFLATWGIPCQACSVFILLGAGFVYWTLEAPAYQTLAYILATFGIVGFVVGPLLDYGFSPTLLHRVRRSCGVKDVQEKSGF